MEQQLHGVEGLKKRKISSWGIAFMVFSMVCAGAFGVEEMITGGGPGLTLIFLIAFPVIWAWPISNMFAEAGAILPREGGIYAWGKEAYGEFWGFCAGWWNTLTVYITNSIYVVLAVGYSAQHLNFTPETEFIAKMGMIAIFTIINLIGLKEVATVNTILAIAVLSAFALVAIVGFINWETNPFDPIIPPPDWEVPLTDAIGNIFALAVWMYCGYEAVSVISGEVENAKKVVPKGLLIAMPLIALTYVLPTMGGLASLGEGNWENWTTEAVADTDLGYFAVLETHLGAAWGAAFLAIAIIGQCAIFNTYIASGSRGFFVLADDNLCPKFLVKLSKKRKIPYIGILSISVVTAFLVQFPFDAIVKMEVIFILGMYIILPVFIHKLRKMYPIEDRIKDGIFVMPGGKVGLWFFTGMPFVMSIFGIMVNGTDYLLMGIVGLLTSIVFYIIFKITCGGLYKKDPVNHPLGKGKLAPGDFSRFGFLMTWAGILGFVGSFFLVWWEGSWALDYYPVPADDDGSGNTGFLADWPLMINMLRYGGIGTFVLGIVLFFTDKKNVIKK